MWKYNFNEGIYAVREYELPLTLGLACLALAANGGGPLSLDRFLFRKTSNSEANLSSNAFSIRNWASEQRVARNSSRPRTRPRNRLSHHPAAPNSRLPLAIILNEARNSQCQARKRLRKPAKE